MFIHNYTLPDGWYMAAFEPPHPAIMIEMDEWCSQWFGPDNKLWRNYIIYGEVQFFREQDLAMFMLKYV